MSTITESHAPTRRSPEDVVEPRSQRGTPTWEMARFYPDQGDWTEEQYLALETNHLIEFDNGVLEFLPMPTAVHALLTRFLFRFLNEFVTQHDLGEVLFAPYRVRVDAERHREPDILYVPKGGKLGRMYTDDAELVVEVVSEGHENRERDLVDKRADYATADIPEYWIVDPASKTITVLTLDGNEYKAHGEFQPGQTATSVLLDSFHVDVTDCFDVANTDEGTMEDTEVTEG